MIDLIRLHIPFKPFFVTALNSTSKLQSLADSHRCSSDQKYYVSLAHMPPEVRLISGALYNSIDGSIIPSYEDLKTPYETLSSGFSGMAFKIWNNGNGGHGWPYVEIKASPAKLASGHNVYGTFDIAQGIANMLYLLESYFGRTYDPSKSDDFGYNYKLSDMLCFDFDKIELAQLDITFSIMAEKKIRRYLIDVIKSFKSSRVSPNMKFDSTVYINKNSNDINQGKVYDKEDEVEKDDKFMKQFANTAVHDVAKKALRFESMVFKRYFINILGINNDVQSVLKYIGQNDDFYIDAWKRTFEKVIDHMRGQDLIIRKDDDLKCALEKHYGHIRGRVNLLMNFYRSLKHDGYSSTKASFSKETFNRNIRQLQAIGLSKAFIESLNVASNINVVSMSRQITIDKFFNPAPSGYQLPNLWERASGYL